MSRYVYQNRTEAPTYSTPVVGYYSAIDPRWTELVAGALDKAQARWDTAVDLTNKYREMLSQVPVSPLDKEEFERAVADNVDSIIKDVNDNYGGDMGRALNSIKEKVANQSLANTAKMSYQWYQNIENIYNNLAAQGKQPVRYKLENNKIVTTPVSLNEYLDEQKAKTLRYDKENKRLNYVNPNITITPRGDYDPYINSLVANIQNYAYTKEEYDRNLENPELSLKTYRSYHGFDPTMFEKYLKMNPGLWDKTVNDFINQNPTVYQEFVDSEGKFDRDLVSRFLKEAIHTRLYQKYYGKTINNQSSNKEGGYNPLSLLNDVSSSEKVVSFGPQKSLLERIFGSLDPYDLENLRKGVYTTEENVPGERKVVQVGTDHVDVEFPYSTREEKVQATNNVINESFNRTIELAGDAFGLDRSNGMRLGREEKRAKFDQMYDALKYKQRASIGNYRLTNNEKNNILFKNLLGAVDVERVNLKRADFKDIMAATVDYYDEVPTITLIDNKNVEYKAKVLDNKFRVIYDQSNKMLHNSFEFGKKFEKPIMLAMPIPYITDDGKNVTITAYRVGPYDFDDKRRKIIGIDKDGKEHELNLGSFLQNTTAILAGLFVNAD